MREYDWGSRRFLAELLGRPAPSPRPEAELWIGAHPRAPSSVEAPEGPVPLPEWIARDPEAVLGGESVRRHGPRLPFLLKVLAVERPLSLQAHPDAEQARAGFEREEARGLPLESPERCYPDANAKPELVCALTDFRALQGLRPAREIRERLEALELPELSEPARALEGEEGPAPLLRALLSGSRARRAALAERAADAAERRAGRDEAFAWAAELARHHPRDPALLAPLLLHAVRLAPGEALFLRARELHCYLEGAAVEVMASSDNVLRGGLTSKHVDLEELLRVLDLSEAAPERLAAAPRAPGERVFETPAPEFELAVLEPGAVEAPPRAPRGAELLLCTEGEVVLHPERGEPLRLSRGEAAIVAASGPAYAVRGRGVAYRARPAPTEASRR